MSIYKRGNIWWYSITDLTGKRIKRSLKTTNKKQAEELYDTIKAARWRTQELSEPARHTLQEACDRWMSENRDKRSIKEDQRYADFFIKELTADILLFKITGPVIRSCIEAIKVNSRHPSKEITNASKNRYLAFIRALLNAAARDWEWIDHAPAIRSFKEKQTHIRWLEPEEAGRLISELPPPWDNIVLLALSTGLRKSNLLEMRWDQIDLDRQVTWVYPEQSKSGKPFGVALNSVAMSVLKAQQGLHPVYVFAVNGRPMRVDANTAWRSALLRAGISDFRFHDLRHTWASWLVQSGVSLQELKEMGGWHSFEMVLKYAHLAPDHMKANAEKLEEKMHKALLIKNQ